ncbi:winged helix DNA-binding protein [Sphingomonas endolithica]|uniref:winged helix DNA-binding protein n=1 Tax=Sphingomonas endolithica TaxID=2972485 RepID=UPI0021B069F0|nr:winged helix DNA-binding protein [Sphingomonas sp. ZFBP2030]
MDTVDDLMRDLTAKLGAIANEYKTRADDMLASTKARAAANGQQVDLVARARAMMADRKARRRYFPTELFHEPAWEMLVALYIIHDTEHTLNVKQLVSCSDAPATTSQRWIEHLHRSGLIDRVTDPMDRRRIDVSLSERGHEAMTRYLSEGGMP